MTVLLSLHIWYFIIYSDTSSTISLSLKTKMLYTTVTTGKIIPSSESCPPYLWALPEIPRPSSESPLPLPHPSGSPLCVSPSAEKLQTAPVHCKHKQDAKLDLRDFTCDISVLGHNYNKFTELLHFIYSLQTPEGRTQSFMSMVLKCHWLGKGESRFRSIKC